MEYKCAEHDETNSTRNAFSVNCCNAHSSLTCRLGAVSKIWCFINLPLTKAIEFSQPFLFSVTGLLDGEVIQFICNKEIRKINALADYQYSCYTSAGIA